MIVILDVSKAVRNERCDDSGPPICRIPECYSDRLFASTIELSCEDGEKWKASRLEESKEESSRDQTSEAVKRNQPFVANARKRGYPFAAPIQA